MSILILACCSTQCMICHDEIFLLAIDDQEIVSYESVGNTNIYKNSSQNLPVMSSTGTLVRILS